MDITYEQARETMLSCMIGVISTLDLLQLKQTVDTYPTELIKDYYERSIDDHAKMTIYYNEWDQ